jgi:hypothetical protein
VRIQRSWVPPQILNHVFLIVTQPAENCVIIFETIQIFAGGLPL